jgi:putative ABC transport system permease protein
VRDLRYAIRFLWAHKGFTIAAVLTLAIGLGANTALYGFLSTALRPLDLPDPEQIVTIAAETKGDETGGFQYSFSIEALKDFQERADPFSAVVGVMPRIGGLSTGGKAFQFWFLAVSDNFFTGLGVTPAAGNLFTRPSGSPVHVVIGHTFWMKTFGGDPGVIGRAVRIDGVPAIVTGVVAPSFRGPYMGVEIDGYLTLDDLSVITPDVQRWLYHNRKARTLQLFGRLRPGVRVDEAQAAVDVLMTTLGAEHPESDQGVAALVIPEPLARPMPMRAVREAIPFVRMFGMAIAGLVLLLACMNVANLLLVRATVRQREMAVRAALGATPGQLVRQMITEGLLLSGLGGVAGYGLGQWVSNAYISRLDLGADLPLRFDVSFDLNVFLFSLGAAVLTGVAIGLWPAWRASRADARAALHDGGKGQSDGVDRQRLRRLLVVGQISGALALLIVAGLFVRTLTAAQEIDLGFDAQHLITVRLDPKQIGYDEDQTIEFYKELQRRVAAWPDVASAAVAFTPPMSYLLTGGTIYVEGRPTAAGSQPPASFHNHAGHNYFETMGIPIVRGRAFVEEDEQYRSNTRKVAIVNESMAAKFWPGEDPIGKRFQLYNLTDPMIEVVGVARDSKYVLVFEAPRPYLYIPLVRDESLRTLHVRASGDPAVLAPRLEREIKALAPDLPIADLRTMSQSLAGIFGFLIFRVGAIQAGGMGVLGLVLAILGVYGVVSFSASLRTREIGIRVALGARPNDVLRLIVGQGVRLVVIGILVGLALSAGMSRVLSQFLPLVDAGDWITFGSVAVGLAALALVACYVPARRATRVPVITALRYE